MLDINHLVDANFWTSFVDITLGPFDQVVAELSQIDFAMSSDTNYRQGVVSTDMPPEHVEDPPPPFTGENRQRRAAPVA